MWPDENKCAVVLTFDFDAESLWVSSKSENLDKPGVVSQGRYGASVGLPLVLDLLGRHSLKATFFVVGQVAEMYPDLIRAVTDAGHELGVHGYTHISPTQLTIEQEESSILQTRKILENYHHRIVGYRSPSWDFSKNTLGLLVKHDFLYTSNMMDDIKPYIHPGTELVELPVQWILDDAAHFYFSNESWNKKIATPSEVLEIWEAEFDGYYELGGVFILTCHPQFIGRPHRIKMLDRFLGFMMSYEKVWFGTCHEIAEWFCLS